MLLRTLFVLLLFATLADTVVEGAYALAQAALHRQALIAVHDELGSAASLARNAVADAIAAGADPRTVVPAIPSPSPTCALASQSGCALEAVATVAFTTPQPGTPSPCPSDDCTRYAQANDAVDEGRIDATIAAQAIGPSGAVLASRSLQASFRTLRIPPYAALAGGLDGSSARTQERLGNDAGAVPQGLSSGTLVDVIYRNAATNASMPANVWRVTSDAVSSAPAWPP